MNKYYKEKLIELKKYLILASMIWGVSLLSGCAGQKLEKQSNEPTVVEANKDNEEINSNFNDGDLAIVVYENGKYIIHDLNYGDFSFKVEVIKTYKNGDRIDIPYSRISMIFYTDEDATAHEKAVVFIDSLELGTGNYIDYDDIKKIYQKKK